MKVALFGPRFSPSFDGVGDHAARVTESLVRAGHHVVVVTESHAARPPCDLVRIGRWDLAGVARVLLVFARRRVDVAVFEYTPFNFGGRTLAPQVLAAYFRLRGTRVATFMHEGFYRPNGTNPMHPLKALALGIRDAAMTAASHAVFAASDERAAAIVSAIPFMRSRVAVVPIGANVEPAPNRQWSAPEGPPYRFVAFGVVAARRRIHLMIEAVALAAARGIAIELRVVGRIFDHAYADACRALAAERGVADRVQFTRELEAADVTSALLGAHVAVHALYEGAISSSGSLLAVLAHGVPLLAVRTPRDEPLYAELATFTSDSPSAILDDALALLATPDAGAARGRLAREIYERDYGWDRIAERMLATTVGDGRAFRRASYARG